MKKLRVLLTGGGTAGHIWPIVSICEALKTNRSVEIIYVGSNAGPEKEIAKSYNINFKGIHVGKWRSYFSLSNFWDLLKTFIGLIQGYFIVVLFKPNVVFAKGGYVTFPVSYWVKRFKIPLVVHESDVVMGKANRWASKFAKKICLGFPPQYFEDLNEIDRQKVVYTGIPIRKDFFNKISIQREMPTILITGGSQGSQKINIAVLEIIKSLVEKYDVYHICGKLNFKDLNNKFHHPNYHLIDFSFDIPTLVRNADLVISRSGANTIAELAGLEKPAIIIPLATAQSDHQSKNARMLQSQNAAVVVSEKNLTGSSLLSIINRLMEDDKFRSLLGHHIHQFAKEDAVNEIIDILFEVEENSGKK